MMTLAKKSDNIKINRVELCKKNLRKNWQLYLIALIPLIYLIVFKYVPMYGLLIAFKRYAPAQGILGSPWVGFYYFEKFINSPWFSSTMINTLRVSLYSILAEFPMPIILALSLNMIGNKYFKKSVQMMTYLPHFISTVVIVGMLQVMLSSQTGFIGKFIEAITNGAQTNVMGSPEAFPHIQVWSGVWQQTGWSSIVYIAALAGVSKDQTEAAIIDGTTRLQRVWYIDIPAIIPTIIILFIMRLGTLLNVGFEKVLLLQNDLNLATSEIISTYSYKIGLMYSTGDFSFGTAIGLFNSVINVILLVTVNAISRKLTETSLW